jgi:2,3-bisphosphoglycerate-dependent phosphoglycerate mutase
MTQPHLTRRGLIGLGAGLAAGAALARGAEPDPPMVIYAVRHAEKAAGDDPLLTDAGTARVAQLVDVLRDVPLRAVYSTDTRRTRGTAQPVAQSHSLEVTLYEPEGANQLLVSQEQRGGLRNAVLVVGHSNTIPELLRELGADFATKELGGHDDLFVVIKPYYVSGTVVLQHLHYGAVSRGAGMR